MKVYVPGSRCKASSQALLCKPLRDIHKKNWGQDGRPEYAALGSAGLKEKGGHRSRKGMKIRPDLFLTWNKNFKAFGERTENPFTLTAKVKTDCS